MAQHFEQRLSVRGDIVIRVIEAATSRLVRRMEIRNMITSSGLATLGQMLAGYGSSPAPAVQRFGEIHVGQDSTAPNTGNTDLIAPGHELSSPFALVTTPVTASLTTVSGQTQVQCIGQLSTSQGNGLVITEAGLFTHDSNLTPGTPVLFARQVFPSITKTNTLAIQFDWRITLTA